MAKQKKYPRSRVRFALITLLVLIVLVYLFSRI
ncbi:hypothetical protein COPR103792_10315 [Corynebacterium propinquum]|nr:hypothetical protein N579_00115 [Corynebacterium pseudodiphtheriticum 090104]ERS39716.1 hypothetical protein HMPREF1292_01176 [Corynebacterium sp. KPL1995]ERS73183.1 hypothetical protein HMPREF1290_01180 [Corynebacterium sp. KPL1989]